MSTPAFLHVTGIVEIPVGAVILAGYTRPGGYVASFWLVGNALNLPTTERYLDIALRDVGIAIAAFTLARLTASGVGAEARSHPGISSILIGAATR